MGCAEMLVVGLLDLIAADLGVSVPEAGALVTANALGLAIGGPVLTFLTTRIDRRVVLLIATAVFIAANLLPALGAGYLPFVVARVLIGAVQGLYIAAAISTATASALGLPLGTLLGQAVGWRGSFTAVVGVAVVVLILAIIVLPSVPTSGDGRALGQARHAFAGRVLAILALCFLIFTGIQSALTYLVPFLTEVSHVSGPLLGAYLLAYGVATTVGSMAGGRFADAGASRTLIVGTIGVTLSLLALFLLGSNPVAAAAAVLGMGLFGMGMAPSMQHRVVSLAGPGAPLASSLPASAVNAGIASGSFAGGLAIAGAGLPAAELTGVVVSVIAIAAAFATSLLTAPALGKETAA
jgi:DHA1 family inner membrane transport protein